MENFRYDKAVHSGIFPLVAIEIERIPVGMKSAADWKSFDHFDMVFLRDLFQDLENCFVAA